MEKLIGMIIEISFSKLDIDFIKQAIDQAEIGFKQIGKECPVELMDVRKEINEDRFIAVIKYDEPIDLFFLASTKEQLKNKKSLDKVLEYYTSEIGRLLTPNNN